MLAAGAVGLGLVAYLLASRKPAPAVGGVSPDAVPVSLPWYYPAPDPAGGVLSGPGALPPDQVYADSYARFYGEAPGGTGAAAGGEWVRMQPGYGGAGELLTIDVDRDCTAYGTCGVST